MCESMDIGDDGTGRDVVGRGVGVGVVIVPRGADVVVGSNMSEKYGNIHQHLYTK